MVIRLLGLLFFTFQLAAQGVYTYIGQITATSVLIAWGSTAGQHGQNTIGRDSVSMGPAEVRIADRTLQTGRNWIDVRGLKPDTTYRYEVQVKNEKIGEGVVRTYPERAAKLTFFVIGDFGTGNSAQWNVAAAMEKELTKRAQSDSPVRFVLTTGDNIYADVNMGYVILRSGDQDRHWDPKFFQPYRDLIRQIPFYPALGNHDGNASENVGDLAVYLDNFFFPENRPSRWYTFGFGGLADFYALDDTDNTTGPHAAPIYRPNGDESKWLNTVLPQSTALWKIPYFHHPPFTAGPSHGASLNMLRHWVSLFNRTGVKVVFTGHEHNFQFSEDSDATGHIRYFVTGAGGELRAGNIQNAMAQAHIEGWAPQHHFLVVEIEGRTMRVTPVSYDAVVVKNSSGKQIPMPLIINLP